MSLCFSAGGQSIGASASASVLPMNVQGWVPLVWLVCLLSKGLKKVFSNTTVQSINSSVLSLLYGPTLTFIHDCWKNHSFDYTNLCQQNNVCFIIHLSAPLKVSGLYGMLRVSSSTLLGSQMSLGTSELIWICPQCNLYLNIFPHCLVSKPYER